MSSETSDPRQTRPAIEMPIQQSQALGQEASPPEPADARAKAAVFAQPEPEKQPPSLLALAAAGMLLHDVVQDTLAPPADEEDDEEAEPKKPAE